MESQKAETPQNCRGVHGDITFSTIFSACQASLARLFLRQVADHGELEHLALVGLQQQDDPEN